ncbi:SDR family oxidoreductase [Streptomyces sp. WMMC500]|uniref:SDR family oxidoreductase n=1 Tax=Streptomyces sp. WMMC500 TaxID=3015154 RepID=UPI00248AFAF4|nr:SDR family oxidoreductase [Streptomyces sp. WMMC500]WBB61217.1 SDR family oxidoreductase [Streptomyces sp. WMMC500]
MKIVVIGGAGLIGSKVVTKLREHGHEAVVADLTTGVDTLTGAGLAEAMTGTQVVIDLSNSPSFEPDAVMKFFTTSTGNLLAAESEAGVGHHLALSIVGTERMTGSGYFDAKNAQEELIEKSGVPFSLVHSTQFYEFVPGIADGATVDGKVHLAPVLFQPIAGEDVAEAVARTAVGGPLMGRIEIAGPEQYRMDEFFRQALAAWADSREVVTDPGARYFGGALTDRSLVPDEGARLGTIGYHDWLVGAVAR